MDTEDLGDTCLSRVKAAQLDDGPHRTVILHVVLADLSTEANLDVQSVKKIVIFYWSNAVLWSRSRKEPELLAEAEAGMSKFRHQLPALAPGQLE